MSDVRRLADLVGQTRAVAVLQNALRRERVAHAYLFAGPEGVGKSTAALLFAQALNCERKGDGSSPDACGECRSCRLIARGNHPDVRVITRETDEQGRQRAEIVLDQLRQDPNKPPRLPRPLIQDALLRPALGRRKVYLLDPADRMRAEAANALLKLIEEPPPEVVLVLVTSQPAALLPTILSRCQRVGFQLVGTAAIEQRLVALGVGAETAAAVSRLSGGRIGWAIQAARQPEVLAARRALLELCADLEQQGVAAALGTAEQVKLIAAEMAAARGSRQPEEAEEPADDEGQEPEEQTSVRGKGGGDRALRRELPWCLEVMASWYRDWLAASHGAALINQDFADRLPTGVSPRRLAQAEAAIIAVLEAKRQVQRNANIDLVLERLAVSLLGGTQ